MKYIIDFDDALTLTEVEEYFFENNITKLKQFGTFGNVFLAEAASEPVINDKVLSVLRDDDNSISLLTVEVDLVDRSVPTSFDIEDTKNWWKVASINRIDFDNTIHEHMIRGVNSSVYLIDSGIAIDHPEFVGANITLLHTFNGNFVDNKGHGTALASLIVGNTCALSNPSLKVVKLFDSTQPTYQSDILGALDAVYADYVANGKKPSVINMSWSIARNDYINNKIQYMINDGMFVVAASGNSGVPIGDVTPASIPDVLTIGAFDQNLTPSAFSNYTGESSISFTASDVNYGALDGWAPGEMIWSANKNGGYGYIAGTSAAAAIASSAFAYNLDITLKDDGSVKENTTLAINDGILYYSDLTLFREGLLDLSNAQYTNSVNKIATFITSLKFNTKTVIHTKYYKSGTTRSYRILSPITSYRFSYETIPDGVTIDNRGFVSVTGNNNNSALESLPEIMLNVLNKDNSSYTFILNIKIWNEEYDTLNDVVANNPNLTEDDPAIEYFLLDDAYCVSSGIDSCTNVGCNTDLHPGCNPGCYNSDPKVSGDCFCDPGCG